MRARPSSAVGSVLLSAQCDWPASRFMTCRSAGHPAECCAMSVGPDPADALIAGSDGPGVIGCSAAPGPAHASHDTISFSEIRTTAREPDYRPSAPAMSICRKCYPPRQAAHGEPGNKTTRRKDGHSSVMVGLGAATSTRTCFAKDAIPLSSHSMWMRATSPVRTSWQRVQHVNAQGHRYNECQ